VLVQVLPLRVLAHPIWDNAETALGHPVAGTISVDPGTSVIALGLYLSVVGAVFLSTTVAVDRQRADWILYALTMTCSFLRCGFPHSRDRRRSTA
jgi:hypothetical protein